MTNNNKITKLVKDNMQLLDALKKLWSVRGTSFTLEQTQHQERVHVEIENILKKYE